MAARPDERLRAMIANMPAKTGRSLADWLTIVAAYRLKDRGRIVSLLKVGYGLEHGYANLVADKALEADGGAPVD